MSAAIDKIEALKEKIRPKLYEYIKRFGRRLTEQNKFQCINVPEHKDTPGNYNCRFADKEQTRWYCHLCNAHGDIFTAAHLLDNKPLYGKEFITENIYFLAKEFGIPFENDVNFTEQEIKNLKHKTLFNGATKILNEFGSTRYGEERGWSAQLCEDLGIGTISHNDFKNNFYKEFYPSSQDSKHLGKNIFGGRKLTFSLKDENGSTVSFAARDLRYKDGEKNPFPKYYNLSKEIYDKSNYLYGLHLARKHIEEPLYIFEGYADAVTAYQHGIYNAVAIGGVSLTKQQFTKLEGMGFKCVRLCFDADKGGKRATYDKLKDISTLLSDIVIQLVHLPEGSSKENSDPDAFIRCNGKEAFLGLPVEKSFDWLLRYLSENKEPEEVCEEMIPHIARSIRPSKWNHDIKILSKATGIMEGLILREVINYADKKEAALTAKKTNIVQEAYRDIIHHKQDPNITLASAMDQIRNVDKQNSEDIVNIESHLEEAGQIFREWESKDPEKKLDGWDTGFDLINETYDGIPKRHGYIGLAASPSMGKTTFFANLVWKMATIEENENLTIVVFTIDDSKMQFIPRLLGIDSGIPSKHIKFPRKYLTDINDFNRVVNAQNKFVDLTSKRRLYIFDASTCSLYSQMVETIRYIKTLDPSRHIVAFLDNLHKLSDSVGDSERTKYKELSGRIKNDVVSEDFTMICTLELCKTLDGMRPVLRDILETGAIEYDCTSIILGYNEVHELRDRSSVYWLQEKSSIMKMPVFEANIAKNKHTGDETTIYLEMNPYTGEMFETTEAKARRHAKRSDRRTISKLG